MLRGAVLCLVATLVTAGVLFEKHLPIATVAAAQGPVSTGLRGVWKVTEQWSRVIGGDWTRVTTPYRSLFIFTEKHYSYMYTLGAEPRRLFAADPNKPTDAEKAAAYSSLVAGTGTYVLSGPALTLTAIVLKNPNEMAGPPFTHRVDIDDTTLSMTIVDPPFLPGREWRSVLTRVE